MAPPMKITTLALVVLQALVLTFLALSTTTSVVHAETVVDYCSVTTDCSDLGSPLKATFFFGEVATPLGYKQVTAICPGDTEPHDCTRIPAPPFFFDPASPSFTCCDKFRIVSGTANIYNFRTNADVKYDETIRLDRYRVFRRTEQPDWQDNEYISCIHPDPTNTFREIEYDSPVGDYTRLDKLEACYTPLAGQFPPPVPPPPPATPAPPAPAPPPSGSITGDPKVVGGDGVTFYFHGRKDQDFCFVSDVDVHVNAHLIGKRPAGRTRDFTWVQALGFVYGPHRLTIATRRVARWDTAVEHLEFVYNGEAVGVSAGAGWASPGGKMALKRTGGLNAVELEIAGKMAVAVTAVGIGKRESDVHRYEITGEDCFAHLDMRFSFYNISSRVDGLLGQTYRPGFVNPVKRGVAMPVMGKADRFKSSSLLATDCPVSQYSATSALARERAPESASPRWPRSCGSSGLPNGVPGGLICR